MIAPHCDGRSESLHHLQAALGHKPLTRSWAKCEILLGLLAVSIGISFLASDRLHISFYPPVYQLVVGVVLFVLGGYLAMAGHRSHLYQSNNELVSYLAGLIEKRPGN